jgi:PilZ domain-containing protein
MAESRTAQRVAAKNRGTAIISGRTEIDCMIRDLSAHGARLSFLNPTILPRQFQLRFDDHDQRVTVVWQAGRLAGVKFQTPIRHARATKKKGLWPFSRRR